MRNNKGKLSNPATGSLSLASPFATDRKEYSPVRHGVDDSERTDSGRSTYGKDSVLRTKKVVADPRPPSPPLKISPRSSPKSSLKPSPNSSPARQRTAEKSFSLNEKFAPTTDTAAAAQTYLEQAIVEGKKKERKRVSFNKRVRIRKIRRLEEMPPEEFEATYFTEGELMGIRNELRFRIRSLVEQNFDEEGPNGDEYIENNDQEGCFCIRGLEHEFPRGKSKRKQYKMMARGAVMEEQRLQREFYARSGSMSSHETMGSFGFDSDAASAVADIYRIESKGSVQIALDLAKRDEYIADLVYFAHSA